MTVADPVFEAHRPRLYGIAYGMLGAVGEAEDVVQDAYLRWHGADTDQIRSAEGFLVTVTTRLAIDRLRSARARRETYVGPWLPEPLVTDLASDPADLVAEAEELSLALLVALERLNPVERAVLVLRDVFDLDYDEIADAVEKSPANCRQIARRARDRVGDPGRRRPVAPEQERALTETFLAAVAEGDMSEIQAMLAHDAILWSDGGGVVNAARKPVIGAPKIALFLGRGIRKGGVPDDIEAALVRVNGEPGIRITGTGVHVVFALEIVDDVITALRVVVNPEKLRHLAA